MRTWANAWSSYKDKLIQWIRGLAFTCKRKGQVCPDSKMMAGEEVDEWMGAKWSNEKKRENNSAPAVGRHQAKSAGPEYVAL